MQISPFLFCVMFFNQMLKSKKNNVFLVNRFGKDTTDATVGLTVCNKKLLPDLYFH